MQKNQKRIIGMGGLAVVAAMTTYAVTIPDAAATSGASTSGQTKISVTVYSSEISNRITSIKDGAVYNNSTITIKNIYTMANRVEYKLYKKTADGGKVYVDLGENATFIPPTTPGSGEHSFDVNLNSSSDLGHGEYVLQTIAYGNSGSVEDSVSFSFAPIKVTIVDVDEDGNIVIDVEHGEDVDSVDVQIYDKDGNPVFDPPLHIDLGEPGDDGNSRIVVDLGDKELPSGVYTISVTGKDKDGDPVDSADANIDYVSPEDAKKEEDASAPEVPKTGDILKNLNISRSDFIITGLIMFGLATFFAVRAIKKRSKKNN